MKFYHYTSSKNRENIKKSGYLEARSLPVRTRFTDITLDILHKKAKNTIEYEKYLVCLDSPFPIGWRESGLFDLMCRKTTAEKCLSFSLDQYEGVFVREHALCTPKLLTDKYGSNLWWKAINKSANKKEIDYYKKEVINYLNSAIPFSKYKNNFICPEFWIPYHIPVENISDKIN